MQDFGASRSAQPRLQGDVRLPGGAVPAVRRHAADLRLQPPQHESKSNGGLDRAGPEQQRRRGAAPLAGHEGESGAASRPLARPAGGVTPPKHERRWTRGFSAHAVQRVKNETWLLFGSTK